MSKFPDPWTREGLILVYILAVIGNEIYHYIKGDWNYPIEVRALAWTATLIVVMGGSTLLKLWWNFMGNNKKSEGEDEKD